MNVKEVNAGLQPSFSKPNLTLRELVDVSREFSVETLKMKLTFDGYARFSASAVTKDYSQAIKQLEDAAEALLVDNYDTDAGRARAYGRFHFLPWNNQESDLWPEFGRLHQFNAQFGLEYTQPAELNSDAAGERRVFKAFSEDLYKNELIVDLVRHFFAAVPFDADTKAGAIVVGLHLIKLAPSPTQPAFASPDLVHRDGEPFTAAVLISRKNVYGGENVITNVCCHDKKISDVVSSDVFDAFTLVDPLDGYIVSDAKVAHYVGPVSCVDPKEQAGRTILLIDYTPSRPVIDMTGL
jgi:hypothetical protein